MSGDRAEGIIDRSRVVDGLNRIEESRRSRRSFLNAAMAAGAAGAVLAGANSNEAAAATRLPTLPYQNDPNWVKSHFQNIINNETNHLTFLVGELGVFARPMPSFTNLKVTSLAQYVKMGSMFCSTGAGAYLGAAPYLQNPSLLMQAGSIGQVELTQSGYLNSLLDLPLLDGGSPYGVPLTLPQILDRAAPYVTSLNGGPEPVFSTTVKSFDNDVAILNVALILEYLEYEFYTGNFATIFPS